MKTQRKKSKTKKLTAIQIKRHLALLKAQIEYPDRKLKFRLPAGFRASFEDQEHFRGWINYHVTWDVTREDPWTVRPRLRSLAAEWQSELIKVVPVISPDGTIMEAEEWEKKVTFHAGTRIITIIQEPDESGDININVKTDLYSDAKEDWVGDESLRRVLLPITPIGGNALPGNKAFGPAFFLNSDWKIQPYAADHRLIIDGVLYSTDGSDPFLTSDTYTVKVMQDVSSLVTTVNTGSSGGITEQDKLDIITGVWRAILADHSGITGSTAQALASLLDLPVEAVEHAVNICRSKEFEIGL